MCIPSSISAILSLETVSLAARRSSWSDLFSTPSPNRAYSCVPSSNALCISGQCGLSRCASFGGLRLGTYLEWQQSLAITTHSPVSNLAAAHRLPAMCPGAFMIQKLPSPKKSMAFSKGPNLCHEPSSSAQFSVFSSGSKNCPCH